MSDAGCLGLGNWLEHPDA